MARCLGAGADFPASTGSAPVLDEPDWRSGVRDYWRVTTEAGDRLWLYYAHGGLMSSGWFVRAASRDSSGATQR